MEFDTPYGTREHEDDLIEFEARQRYDEEHGLELGDPRRCPTHGTIISSPCGRFDGLCGLCEQGMDLDAMKDEDARRDERPALEPLTPSPDGVGYLEDDIRF